MKKILIYNIIFVLLICISLPNFARADDSYKKHPGYVEFGNLEGFMDAEETVEVFIRGPLLKFVSKATQGEDPELSRLLSDLVVIKVNVFSTDDKEKGQVLELIANIAKDLKKKNWETMVKVKEKGERVEIFTLFDNNDEMQGLTIMVMEDGVDQETVFINIAGKIDPEQLGKLGDKFDIPELDDVDVKKHQSKK